MRDKTTLLPIKNGIKVLIMLLAKLLDNNLEEDKKISAFFISINLENISETDLNLLHILTTSFYKVNYPNPGGFVFAIQLNI